MNSGWNWEPSSPSEAPLSASQLLWEFPPAPVADGLPACDRTQLLHIIQVLSLGSHSRFCPRTILMCCGKTCFRRLLPQETHSLLRGCLPIWELVCIDSMGMTTLKPSSSQSKRPPTPCPPIQLLSWVLQLETQSWLAVRLHSPICLSEKAPHTTCFPPMTVIHPKFINLSPPNHWQT